MMVEKTEGRKDSKYEKKHRARNRWLEKNNNDWNVWASGRHSGLIKINIEG